MEYCLSNRDITVTFSTLGGSLTSVKDRNGTEYLWQGDPAYWSGQAPVLFPICGSLRNDMAHTLDGKTIRMPRHGIVRKKEFNLDFLTQGSICFKIDSTEEMLDMYPYQFTLYILYQLIGRSISITYRIMNRDIVQMPFFIGGHPGFRCPLDSADNYSDYCLEFEVEECCSAPTSVTETGLIDMEQRNDFLDNTKVLPLAHRLFEKDAVVLDQLKSRRVRFCNKDTDKGIELEFSDFPYLILWSSPNQGPFIALEPWSGLSTCSDEDDIFEHKRGVLIAEPGKTTALSYCITIL